MATRVRLRDRDRDWTLELSGGAVQLDGAAGPMAVADLGDGRWRVEHDGRADDAVGTIVGDVVWVQVGGDLFEFHVVADRDAAGKGRPHHDALTPPMSATVIRVAVREGERVAAGDTLVVLEAMKMELPIRAPHDGVVTAVLCREGDLVQPGTVLVELD